MIIRHYLLLPLEVCFFKSFLGSALVEQWSSFNQERFMIEVPFWFPWSKTKKIFLPLPVVFRKLSQFSDFMGTNVLPFFTNKKDQFAAITINKCWIGFKWHLIVHIIEQYLEFEVTFPTGNILYYVIALIKLDWRTCLIHTIKCGFLCTTKLIGQTQQELLDSGWSEFW